MIALKSKSASELADVAARMGRDGRTLVLTNGCFDLLHEGHRTYLIQARARGDALAVALNSDASVQRLKGPGRPVRNEHTRAADVAALECVDFVTVFDDTHVTGLVQQVRPQLYVKGGDYTVDTIEPGLRAMLEREGIAVAFVGLVPGVSTTAILASLSPEQQAALRTGQNAAPGAAPP